MGLLSPKFKLTPLNNSSRPLLCPSSMISTLGSYNSPVTLFNFMSEAIISL